MGVMESGEKGEGLGGRGEGMEGGRMEGGGMEWGGRGRDGGGRKGEGWRGETLVWSKGGRGAGLTHLGSSSPVPVHGRSPSLMSHGGSCASSFVGDGEGCLSPLWSFTCWRGRSSSWASVTIPGCMVGRCSLSVCGRVWSFMHQRVRSSW